jgi:hypothetical protein
MAQPRGLLGKAYAPTFMALGVILIALAALLFS